jgi:excinuclease ABC subunit C
MFLVQRVRDEAHRFAITFHRQRRSRSMMVSELDQVPGLGPARRTALLKHFGSLKRLKEATPEQIAEVPGIGLSSATKIAAALHGGTPPGEAPPGEARPGEAPPGEAPPGEAPPGDAPPGDALRGADRDTDGGEKT